MNNSIIKPIKSELKGFSLVLNILHVLLLHAFHDVFPLYILVTRLFMLIFIVIFFLSQQRPNPPIDIFAVRGIINQL